MARAKISLAEAHPELLREWHLWKNPGLDPAVLGARSPRKVWWQCSKHAAHEWMATIVHRSKDGSACPFCANKRPTDQTCLAVSHPQVASEWHPTRNGALTPWDVVPGSARRVWWRCPLDPRHVWRAGVYHRAIRLTGCPRCLERNHVPAGSLPGLSRALRREWHSERNLPLEVGEVTSGSPRIVWWRCRRDPAHEWRAAIGQRARAGHGCPFCVHRAVDHGNSLRAIAPELAREWHPTRNAPLTPDDVVAGAGRRVWWKCPRGQDHEWAARVRVRALEGIGCPFCANQRTAAGNSLPVTHPELARQWHPTKNGGLRPEEVVAGTNRLIWWSCPEGPDHVWQATGAGRISGKGCPFCAGQKVSVTNSLSTRAPGVAEQWHPTKNGDLHPSDVHWASASKRWWRCAAGPDHEWEASVMHRTRSESGCPFCAGRAASVTNSLLALLPALAAEWHPTRNAPLTPSEVTLGSGRLVWWKCPQGDDHEWEAPIHKRAGRGHGCPFCSGRRACMATSLATVFPEVAREWDPARNGDVTPAGVLSGAKHHYWWLCPRGHSWRAAVRSRTVLGTRCPTCALTLAT